MHRSFSPELRGISLGNQFQQKIMWQILLETTNDQMDWSTNNRMNQIYSSLST